MNFSNLIFVIKHRREKSSSGWDQPPTLVSSMQFGGLSQGPAILCKAFSRILVFISKCFLHQLGNSLSTNQFYLEWPR